MSDDHDVLTLLRKQSTDSAPSLTLQADDVLRGGRRRQRRHRVLGLGAGLAAGACLVAVAVSLAGGEPSSTPAPTDETTSTPDRMSAYNAHSMPAILKEAALSPLDRLPKWTDFRIEALAYQGTARPLPEARWDRASMWRLGGAAKDGRLELAVIAGDRTAMGVGPDTYCAAAPDAMRQDCGYKVLADGRVVVEMRLKPISAPDSALSGHAELWYGRAVKVYDPVTGYSVQVSEWAAADDIDAADARLWLTPHQLVGVATNPILDLAGVLPQPSAVTPDE